MCGVLAVTFTDKTESVSTCLWRWVSPVQQRSSIIAPSVSLTVFHIQHIIALSTDEKSLLYFWQAYCVKTAADFAVPKDMTVPGRGWFVQVAACLTSVLRYSFFLLIGIVQYFKDSLWIIAQALLSYTKCVNHVTYSRSSYLVEKKKKTSAHLSLLLTYYWRQRQRIAR